MKSCFNNFAGPFNNKKKICFDNLRHQYQNKISLMMRPIFQLDFDEFIRCYYWIFFLQNASDKNLSELKISSRYNSLYKKHVIINHRIDEILNLTIEINIL
jgi:hypothetical protein